MAYSYSRSLPPMEAMIAALAAAKNGSFSAAATELNITHAAVSRRIAVAEDWAGVQLFKRHRRGAEVTERGERFLIRISRALEILENTPMKKRGSSSKPLVRISTTASFAEYWLIPRLAALEGRPPDVRIEIIAEQRLADLMSSDIDIAIRYGHGGWKTGIEEILFEELLHPVAAPELLEHKKKYTPQVLVSFPLLHCGDTTKWRAWFRVKGLPYHHRSSDRIFSSDALTMAAAASGLGIALGSKQYDWTANNLVWIKDPAMSILSPMKYHLITKPTHRVKEIEVFLRRLKQMAVKSEWRFK